MSKSLTLAISIFTFVYLIIDGIFHNSWYQANVNLAVSLQNTRNFFFDFVFGLASFSVYEFWIGPLIFFIFIVKANKITVLAYISFIIFTTFLLSLLKIIYFDGRPYYDFEDIMPLFICDKEFGNPSGHAFGGVVIYSLLLIYFLQNRFDAPPKRKITNERVESEQLLEPYSNLDENEDENNRNDELKDGPLFQNLNQNSNQENDNNSKSKFQLYWTLTIIWIFLIGLSRIYFGSHSFNQILLGYVYGTFSLILFHFYLRDLTEEFLDFLTFKGHSFNLKRNSILLILVFLFILFNLIALTAYLIADSLGEVNYDWIVQIEQKCFVSVKVIDYFFYKCFTDCGVINWIFGMCFGIIFARGDYNPKEFSVNLKLLGAKKIALRVLILMLTIVIPGLIIFIPYGTHVLLKYFLQRFLMLTLIGFSMIWIPPVLYKKLDIDIDGDYLKKESSIF